MLHDIDLAVKKNGNEVNWSGLSISKLKGCKLFHGSVALS